MKTLLLTLLILIVGCSDGPTLPVQPNPWPLMANTPKPDTTLCCPPGYHCAYRPDAGKNQFGSYWWCVNDTNKNQGAEPTRCN
jgi:hypothetical protein